MQPWCVVKGERFKQMMYKHQVNWLEVWGKEAPSREVRAFNREVRGKNTAYKAPPL